MTINHMAARIAPPWKAPPGSFGADPDEVDGDHDAERRQQLGEEGERAFGPRDAPRAGSAAPVAVGASDHTPITARTSTTFSSMVSKER